MFVPLNSCLSSFLCSDLDSNLQDALKGYLIAKGIGEDLTNFLLFHLHKKELGQYVKWLQKLESLLLGKFDEARLIEKLRLVLNSELLDATAESLKRILRRHLPKQNLYHH
ncbi:hypothetical protein OIU76_010476 [Salix suchowensis]|nr:hypothetical protein OIU76_010476 [Salix suchowensis]